MSLLTLNIELLPNGNKRLTGGGQLDDGKMADLFKELSPRQGFLNLAGDALKPGLYDWDWNRDTLTPRK